MEKIGEGLTASDWYFDYYCKTCDRFDHSIIKDVVEDKPLDDKD
jgi:hypothetical protein